MKRLIFLAASVLSLGAFAAMPENPADHIVKAMNVLNEQNLSCQTDDDCSSVAYGSKACGGPNGFMVVSSNNGKLNQINTLANLTERVEEDYNRENEINSTCDQILAPETKCIQNSCVEAW